MEQIQDHAGMQRSILIKTVWLLLLWAVFAPSQAQLSVIDDTGNRVLLDQPAQRIVTLSPHTAELILAIGAGEKLVAVATHDEYPPVVDKLPEISSFNGLDRERLLLLKPDLVVAWTSGNKPGDIRWLLDQGIPVYQSEPTALADIAASMKKLGIATGTPETGNAAARQFLQDLAGSCPSRSLKFAESAYYEIWPDPPMTIGGNHWLNEVLELAGLYNVFRDQPRQVFTVEPEALVARPASVHITPYAGEASALIKGRLVKPDPLLSRPGPRIAEGLRLLCSDL